MSIPSYMIPSNHINRRWPAEYPAICNQYKDYSNPPLPIPKCPPGMFGAPGTYRVYCLSLYSDCYKKYHVTKKKIEARQAAERQAKLNSQKVAETQKKLNNNYQALLKQYQQLLNQLIAERNAHRQDVQELNRLKTELGRIRNILQGVGLI